MAALSSRGLGNAAGRPTRTVANLLFYHIKFISLVG